MNTISEQIENIDWKSDDSIIDFYRSNILYFNNYQSFTSYETIIQGIELKLHYVNSLINKSYFQQGLPIIDEIDYLLKKVDLNDERFTKYSNHSKFSKGIIYGHLKKYRECHNIFKDLIKLDPDHHYYKLWYTHSKIHIYMWIVNGISIMGAIIVFLSLVFEDEIPNSTYLNIIGFIMCMSGVIIPKILKRKLKIN